MEATTAKKLAAKLQALEEKVPGQLHTWLLTSAADRAKKSSSLAELVGGVTNKLYAELCLDFANALEREQRQRKKTIYPDLAALPAIRAICWGLLALFPHSLDLLDCLDTVVHYPTPDLASLSHLKQARPHGKV